MQRERDIGAVLAVRVGRSLASTGAGRAMREGAGLTLRDLAAAVGVAHSTLARWETGAVVPRADAARRYAATLEVLTNHGRSLDA